MRFPLVALSCLLLAPSLAAKDKIYKVGSRKPINVSIVSEDTSEVKYSIPGTRQTQSMPSADVDLILYDDAPESFQKGLDYLETLESQNAIDSFKVALGESAKWLDEYANFYLGRAYALGAARNPSYWKTAADSYAACLAAKADSRFLAEALLGQGVALSRSGDADGAAAAFDKLVSEAKTNKLGIIWEARGLIEKALAYEDNDVPSKAKVAFKAAGDFAAANAEAQSKEAVKAELAAIAGRAQLSEGVALLKDEDYRGARRAFESIAADAAAAPQVIAQAQCGLGEVDLAEGNARRAMEKFARVRVTAFLEKEAAARATYFLGKCCLALGKDEPNGARKARMYFTEVVEHYGDTVWANRAQAEL